jgi:formiminoglutamase
MDLSIYFSSIPDEVVSKNENTLGFHIHSFTSKTSFPDLKDAKLAIVGVNEDRGNVLNAGASKSPDFVRKYLYQLYCHHKKNKIVDLGNIQPGNELNDTYFALKDVVGELNKQNIIPIILGGTHDLTFANYSAYQQLEQIVNIVTIDNRFDFGKPDEELNAHSFLSKIILDQPNVLFNYCNLGHQSYFVAQNEIDLVAKLFFDAIRLGELNKDISLSEHHIRNADIVSFDMSAIRMSDAPGNKQGTPNGFYGEEACQMARYAGMSDKLSSIGFYEHNPEIDKQEQTAHLLAQMIWYFIDGFANRKNDFPKTNKKEYVKYRVFLEDDKYELVFYKSKKSDRWWLDVPYPPTKGLKFERQHIVPCAYADYVKATEGEMPDIWWKTYQKLI